MHLDAAFWKDLKVNFWWKKEHILQGRRKEFREMQDQGEKIEDKNDHLVQNVWNA